MILRIRISCKVKSCRPAPAQGGAAHILQYVLGVMHFSTAPPISPTEFRAALHQLTALSVRSQSLTCWTTLQYVGIQRRTYSYRQPYKGVRGAGPSTVWDLCHQSSSPFWPSAKLMMLLCSLNLWNVGSTSSNSSLTFSLSRPL